MPGRDYAEYHRQCETWGKNLTERHLNTMPTGSIVVGRTRCYEKVSAKDPFHFRRFGWRALPDGDIIIPSSFVLLSQSPLKSGRMR
jgi:hypothetical protein